MKSNKIDGLSSIKFHDNVTDLMNVDFSDNPIKLISPDAFTNLTELRWLDLSSTSLTRLPLALASLKQMFQLKLSNFIPFLL